MKNPTTGQAQVQLFASCVGTQTGTGGRLDLTDARSASVALRAGEVTARTLQCAPGSVAIAPSFDVGDSRARVVSSEPAANGSSWSFAVRSTGDGAADLGVRCLSTSLSDGSRLVVASQSSTATIGAGDRRTASLDVGDGRAAIAAGYTVPVDGSVTMLGREPQGRNALFSYENAGRTDGSVSQTALVLSIVASSPDPVPVDPAPAATASASPATSGAAAATPAAPAPTPGADATAAKADAADAPTATTAGASRRVANAPVALTAPKAVSASSLTRGLRMAVRLAGSGRVTTVVTDGGRRVAKVTTTMQAGPGTIAVAVPRKVRARLGRAGHRTLKVTVTAGGTSTTKLVKVTR
ncbi:MAG: hypothetical protein F2817_18680 [Actinobacteria bacterium]|nr:hypothetical protein [Actinomycetota bacterium]